MMEKRYKGTYQRNGTAIQSTSFKRPTTSKHNLYQTMLVITVGIAIGVAIGMHAFHAKEVGDHLTDTSTNSTRDETKVYSSAYGVYRHAAVASDAKICSDIGRDIMGLHGGNAIDAAIATSFCSGLLHSQSTGIGGGMFAVVYHKKHGVHAIDARETAPLAASRDMFAEPGFKSKSKDGGLSICVPGILKGYIEMHTRFGSLPWKSLVVPTIKLARDGFPLTAQTYQGVIRTLSPAVERMSQFEMFLDENSRIKPQGSIIRMPKLAQTLERIADNPMSFYSGSLAQDIVQDLQEAGSIITEIDLLKYTALVKTPTMLDLPGEKTLYSVPSPAAGPTLSYIISILSGYEMTPASFADDKTKIQAYHRLMEALKFTYARKTGLGDEDFVDIESLSKNLTSREYGEQTRLLIDETKTHDIHYYGPKYYSAEQHGTSHSSIIDSEGNAVAITSSINLYFGSRVVGRRTGIFFNDQINDFSHPFLSNYHGLQPAEANFIHPRKRPLSAMCPAIVWDKVKGRVDIVVGAAGGPKIQGAVAMNLMNLLWFNMSVPESIDQPRLLHELLPNDIQSEAWLPANIRVGLEEKGHTFLKPIGITVVQMIQVLEDAIVAGSDFRKLGEPSGF